MNSCVFDVDEVCRNKIHINLKGECLMGELENYIYKLAKALHNKDKKQRDQILAELRQLGMDSSTALTLAMDYSVD